MLSRRSLVRSHHEQRDGNHRRLEGGSRLKTNRLLLLRPARVREREREIDSPVLLLLITSRSAKAKVFAASSLHFASFLLHHFCSCLSMNEVKVVRRQAVNRVPLRVSTRRQEQKERRRRLCLKRTSRVVGSRSPSLHRRVLDDSSCTLSFFPFSPSHYGSCVRKHAPQILFPKHTSTCTQLMHWTDKTLGSLRILALEERKTGIGSAHQHLS